MIHIHTARLLTTGGTMMLMSFYLVIGSLWIIFGLVYELSPLEKMASFNVIMTSASIIWSAISAVIALVFVGQSRKLLRKLRHERKA
ncbi:MAG: hypothetical protein ACP5US_04140 [Candidatus Kryptoniota bacterium]